MYGTADCEVVGHNCDVVVDVSRPEESDHGTWQDLWYAANTVYWKCVKQGKAGEVTGLGMFETSRHNEKVVLIEGHDRD